MRSFHLTIMLAAVLSAVFFYGCASIFTGTDQTVSINSSPTKADFVVKEMKGGVEVTSGTTPATIKLAKKNEYTVAIKLPGYKDATVAITQSLQGWFWGNLICGGVVGMIIDYVDGAMWDLEPNQVMISLVSATAYNGPTRLYAVFRAYDDHGQLKTMVVPLIRNQQLARQGL